MARPIAVVRHFVPAAAKPRTRVAALLLAVSGVAGAGVAPDPEIATEAHVEQITVTGYRNGVGTIPSLDDARAAAREIAGGVSVIDSATFRAGRAATPEDALRFAPGVFVAARFGSEESRLSIRGSGLQRTFHGRGIMFLQDGVPLNLADGSGDFQALEPLSTRYVEVFRGANALQLGATTLGGAVNFVSPSGRSGDNEVRAEAGAFGYRRGYASLAAAGERTDLFVSASHYGRDGFQAHAAQSTQRLMANLGQRISDDFEQRFYLAAVTTESELPGSLTQQEFRAGDVRRAAPASVQGDNRRDFDLYRLAYRANWRPRPDSRLEFATWYSTKDLFHPIFQVLEQDSEDYGIDLRFSRQAPFGRDADRLVFGARAARGETRDDRFLNVGGRRGARTDRSDQHAENQVYHAEYSLGFARDWSLVAGLQWVHALRRFEDRCHAASAIACAGPDQSFRKRFDALLPRAGLVYDVDERIQVFANVSRQYEPPTFGEISGGPGVDLLDAQRGTTWEIGSRGRLDRVPLEWDAALYWAELDRELLALQVGPDQFRTVNADRTRHRGVELGFTFTLPGALEARVNYQHNDFRYRDDPGYGDNRIAGVPTDLLRGELTWRPFGERAHLTANLSAASASWVDHRNRVAAPGHAVFGLRAGFEFTPTLHGFVEGRNLTDKVHAATHGVVGDATLPQSGEPQRLFNPGDGRAFYAGLTWSPRS